MSVAQVCEVDSETRNTIVFYAYVEMVTSFLLSRPHRPLYTLSKVGPSDGHKTGQVTSHLTRSCDLIIFKQ